MKSKKPYKQVNQPKRLLQRSYRKTRYVLYKETLIDVKEHFWAFWGSFIGLGLISFLHFHTLSGNDFTWLIGSFGASCVLVYGVIASPLAQPRNLIGGHVVSALIGVTIAQMLPQTVWIAAPLAVSLSIVCMQWTKTLHPPGGATALIAVTGGESIQKLGYFYVLFPVLSGACLLLVVALIFNNIPHNRQYPAQPVRFFKKERKK